MTDAVFTALADPTRREMLVRLSRNGPQTSGALTSNLGMTRQGASRHLEVLEQSGLVKSRKQGRMVIRDLDLEELKRTLAWLNTLASAWDERLSRLESMYREP